MSLQFTKDNSLCISSYRDQILLGGSLEFMAQLIEEKEKTSGRNYPQNNIQQTLKKKYEGFNTFIRQANLRDSVQINGKFTWTNL
ncbi:unnamed protein product [Citrullus colocynthis]|uniref:Uncharacterized protein n=1 Tax=Citrullus colocynthis TaxID=252529 RepID=A0ABP0Y3H6_9ROSI